MVTVLGGILLVTLALAGATAYRRRDDRQYLAIAVIGVLGIAVWLFVPGGRSRNVVTAFDLPLAVVAFVVIAEAVGLPGPIATMTGVGFRSREWEYDRRLTKAIARIQDSIASRRDRPSSQLVAEDRRYIAQLRSLRAPNAEWQRLTQDYADAYDGWFVMLAAGSIDQSEALTERLESLHRQRDALRSTGRAEASRRINRSRAARVLRRRPPSDLHDDDGLH